LVKDVVLHFLNLGIDPEDLVIISPYEDQVALIKNILQLEESVVDIKTADDFQGKKISVSFVRSKLIRRDRVSKKSTKVECVFHKGNAKTHLDRGFQYITFEIEGAIRSFLIW
jgi:hypothetical protein